MSQRKLGFFNEFSALCFIVLEVFFHILDMPDGLEGKRIDCSFKVIASLFTEEG